MPIIIMRVGKERCKKKWSTTTVKPEKAAPPCAGGLSAVDAIGTHVNTAKLACDSMAIDGM